jgi:hypothetical protein
MMLPDRDAVRVENRSGRCWAISKDSSRETFPLREPDVDSPWPMCLRIVNDRAPALAVAGSWHQVELLGLADRCPTVVHTELGQALGRWQQVLIESSQLPLVSRQEDH